MSILPLKQDVQTSLAPAHDQKESVVYGVQVCTKEIVYSYNENHFPIYHEDVYHNNVNTKFGTCPKIFIVDKIISVFSISQAHSPIKDFTHILVCFSVQMNVCTHFFFYFVYYTKNIHY